MVKKVINDPALRLLRKNFQRFTLFLLSIFFSIQLARGQAAEIPTDEAIIKSGEGLFKELCTVCHGVNNKVIGPALQNVYDRKDMPWIIAFVQNSQKVIQSGDPYAVALYNEYNKTQMNVFDYLTEEEVVSIIAYVKHETENPTEVAGPATSGDTESGGADQSAGSSISSEFLTAILIGIFFILILILGVLGLIISVLSKYLKDKKDLDEADKELVAQKFEFGKLIKSPAFLGIVVFIFTAIVLKTVIDGLYTVGIQKHYEPTQPIAFSHALHAGEYEIDCNYCHTGVMKSKNANIPSANICMNCHSAIQNVADKEGISPEIKKIYAALDYDPTTASYGPNQKPIEWIRVHNLPDLAYFNHSQHVNVGGIECQTCHGPIEEMVVVKQHESLTMGWCIDCHRRTEVNTLGNAYYDQLVELHEASKNDKMKVEDIGGLECARCHY